MRKTFQLLALACGFSLTVSLTSCGGGDPKAVVDDAFTAMKEGDTEDLMDCIYLDDLLDGAESWRDLKDELPEAVQHQMKMVESVAPMLQGMLKNVTWKFGDVERDGDEAVVSVKMNRGDEDEIESRVKVVKDKSGHWKIKSMGDLM